MSQFQHFGMCHRDLAAACPTLPAYIGVRANIHLGGQTEFCPNCEHKLFVTQPRQGEEKKELLQSLFFDGKRVIPDERLLCHTTRDVSGRWILVPFGDTVSLKINVLSFARINVALSDRIGGTTDPPDPIPERLCRHTSTVGNVKIASWP